MTVTLNMTSIIKWSSAKNLIKRYVYGKANLSGFLSHPYVFTVQHSSYLDTFRYEGSQIIYRREFSQSNTIQPVDKNFTNLDQLNSHLQSIYGIIIPMPESTRHQNHLASIADLLQKINTFFSVETNKPTSTINQRVVRVLQTKINAYLRIQPASLEHFVQFTDDLVITSNSLIGEMMAPLYVNTLHMCAMQLNVSAKSMQLLPNDMEYHTFVIKKSKKALARFIMCMGGQHTGQPDAELLHELGKALLEHHIEVSTPISWAHVEHTVDKLLKL